MSGQAGRIQLNNKRFFTDWRLWLIGIFVLSILAYLPSLHGQPIWDDLTLIDGTQFGGNNYQAAFFHPFGNYYRPLTSASFVFDTAMAHGATMIYHQTNILLHAFTAVLVCLLAFLVTDKKLAGVLAGVFFALQPMQVSAVAWIGGRTDALSAFFIAGFLVSLLLYIQRSNRWWLALCGLCYILAALSKEQAAAILPVAPVAVYVFGKKGWKDSIKATAWLAVPLVIYILMYLKGGPMPQKVENSLIETVALSLRTDAFYGFALFIPNKASLVVYTLENYQGAVWIAMGAAFVVSFIGLFWLAVQKAPKIAWVALCGFMVYIPVCNFPTLPSMVIATYRLGEAGVAAACMFGIAAAYFYSSKKFWLAGLAAVNLLAGTVVTWWGVHQWSTPKHFFEQVAYNDPHFLVGVLDYSQFVDDEGNHEEAIRVSNQTLAWFFGTDKWLELLEEQKMAAVTPDVHKKLQANFGKPMLQTLGNFIGANAGYLARGGQIDRARRVGAMAKLLAPKDPWVHYLYGKMIYPVDKKQAVADWQETLRLNPDYASCAVTLGQEWLREHKYSEAEALFTRALKQLEISGQVWLMLAQAKSGVGDMKGAEDALAKAGSVGIPASQKDIDAVRQGFSKTAPASAASH